MTTHVLASLCSFAQSFFTAKQQTEGFTAVVEDSRDWAKHDTTPGKTSPPGNNNPNFLWGPATCTYQDSGAKNCPNSQWPSWELKVVEKGNRSGKSADLFNLYQTKPDMVIDRIKQLGNAYRFSIEWSHIEPTREIYDETKLQIYVNFCKALRDAGVTPMVTLHHFSEPKWFHEKGSFEKRENIGDFVDFAEFVFGELTADYKGQPLVKHFCTINEPAIEAFSRYIRGAFSPGYFCRFRQAGNFLYGALKAHCIAYNKLKAICPDAQVGIVHQYLPFRATSSLISPVTRYLSQLVNDVSLQFFKTGVFELKIPFLCHIRQDIQDDDLEFKTDFVGLQYYVRPIIGFIGPTSFHGEPMTAMPLHEDPEGMYDAIVKTHQACNAPIIITESGISTHDPKQRNRYMERVLYAARKAQEVIGEPNLLGYFLWCFTEKNAEWDMGMQPQSFGAFESTSDGGLAEQPRLGLEAYTETVAAWKESLNQADTA